MEVKEIGLGGAWWDSTGTEADCIEAIHRALDLGIDYFDTYPELEPWWGKALAGRRHEIRLQAKVTSLGPDGTTVDYSAAQTRRSVEASLRRLRTDYLDTLLIHGFGEPDDAEHQAGRVDPLAPGNALDELVRLKKEGKIRHIGMGARNLGVLRRAIASGHVDIVLTYLEYNLFHQGAAEQLFPLARAQDIGVLIASPLGWGCSAASRRWSPRLRSTPTTPCIRGASSRPGRCGSGPGTAASTSANSPSSSASRPRFRESSCPARRPQSRSRRPAKRPPRRSPPGSGRNSRRSSASEGAPPRMRLSTNRQKH